MDKLHLFKFGERVEVAEADFSLIPEEKRPKVRTGVVHERSELHSSRERGFLRIAVRLDQPFSGGHTLGVTKPPCPCENGFGWYAKRENVRSLEAK
jgi:hypothetical protein